jgi:phosphoribosylanthranilate isomerase
MFRVKICGVTRVEDALVAVETGADAIGLNFYEKSPRCVTPEIARGISREMQTVVVERVGVFVNKDVGEIEVVAKAADLSAVQLHGDESPDAVAHLAHPDRRRRAADHWNVIRARRIATDGVGAIAADLQACLAAGWLPSAVLVDSMAPGHFGGSGKTVAWDLLVDHRQHLGQTPLILAGGLTPDNVAEAIRIVRPAAVDVASGVESSPGKKDPVKVRDFVANALGALAAFD